jgi:hypothetical protein
VSLALAGCALFNEPQERPIKISTVATPTDLRLGDTARVIIDIVNISSASVQVSSSGCNNDFVLESAAGAVFYAAERVYCTLELRSPISLAPGASHRVFGFTTGRVIPQSSQSAPVMLEPGTYTIRAVIGVVKGDKSAVTVRSDPMTITFRQ